MGTFGLSLAGMFTGQDINKLRNSVARTSEIFLAGTWLRTYSPCKRDYMVN